MRGAGNINTINKHMEITTSTYRGGTHGTRFVHSPPSGDLASSTITIIIIGHGHLIDSLQVFYNWSNGASFTHGGSGGSKRVIGFAAGEFITGIEGYSTAEGINQLTIVTTLRRCGPYGRNNGQAFTWGAAGGDRSPLTSRMRLLVFSGRSDGALHGLQATFGEYKGISKVARYRSVSRPLTTTSGSTLIAAAEPVGTATFSCHLMSPIVTLSVGQDSVQFHVHEDTLCSLPFFQAALHGHFKEATDKIISMPEDDPSKICALVEFLYTGNYTYIYDPLIVHVPDKSAIPAGDLEEGLYHVGVYVIASKYDCPALSEMAIKNFRVVATELSSVGTLRLWKAAYEAGLQLSLAEADFFQYRGGEGLVAWAKGLFREEKQEMEDTMEALPKLACDLLRTIMGE